MTVKKRNELNFALKIKYSSDQKETILFYFTRRKTKTKNLAMSFAKNEQAKESSVQFNRINKVQP